jgi:hypothetical protein
VWAVHRLSPGASWGGADPPPPPPLHHGDSLVVRLSAPAAAATAASPPPPGFPRVLVLTPVKDSQRHLARFFSLLRNASYPPGLLSLGIIDGDSTDVPSAAQLSALGAPAAAAAVEGGAAAAAALAASAPSATLAAAVVAGAELVTTGGWRRVTVARHDFGFSLGRAVRHGVDAQRPRREVLARARNHLLSTALEDEDWVLWLDSDLKWHPPDLLHSLLAAATLPDGSPAVGSRPPPGARPIPHAPRAPPRLILVPNCVLAPGGGRSYDLNSWRGGGERAAPGSNASVARVAAFHDATRGGRAAGGALALEGYGNTGARYLHQFRWRSALTKAPKDVVWLEEDGVEDRGVLTAVRLDGVGGAALLAHAELFRHGLVFPPFPYRGRIETEGLAMMAMDMGVLSWGLPFLEVQHA